MIINFKKILGSLALGLSLFLIQACTATSGTSEAEYGTVINTAKPPANNVIPDFDSYIADETLGETSTSTGSALVKSTSKTTLQTIDGTLENFVTSAWNGNFKAGGISNLRDFKDELNAFGANILEAMNTEGITAITSTRQSITVTGTVMHNQKTWRVDFLIENSDPNFIRFYFYDADHARYDGTYLVKLSDNLPVQGLFVMLNPELLSDRTDKVGPRMMALAYDFTNTTRNLITMRAEQYHVFLGQYYTYQVHQQCNVSTLDCVGEYQDIIVASPARELSEWGTRFSWNDNTGEVCLADIETLDNSTQTLHTFAFEGPSTPAAEDIEVDTCSVTTPYWAGTPYQASMLPMRYEDTTPSSGTSGSYYGDGTSTSGLDQLVPSLIATWLDASGF